MASCENTDTPNTDQANQNRERQWKLLDKRCTQLSDTVSAARIPFLLALTWSFAWFWGLYVYEYGYITILKKRYEAFYLLSQQVEEDNTKKQDNNKLAENSAPTITVENAFCLTVNNNKSTKTAAPANHPSQPNTTPPSAEKTPAEQTSNNTGNCVAAPKKEGQPQKKYSSAADIKGNVAICCEGSSNVIFNEATQNKKADEPQKSDKTKLFVSMCEKHMLKKDQLSLYNTPIDITEALTISHCKEVVKKQYEYYQDQLNESRWVTFPGGFQKVKTADLGVIANIGLLLILAWGFFAARRENHAILSFIDMSDQDRKFNRIFPSEFNLVCTTNLNAEQLCYAYHSVSQRFVFLLSKRSKPLLTLTLLLMSIPACVSAWNLVTDL